jgi:hypothetical protein
MVGKISTKIDGQLHTKKKMVYFRIKNEDGD